MTIDLFTPEMECSRCHAPLGVAYYEPSAGVITCCNECSHGHACGCRRTGAVDAGTPLPVALANAHKKRTT